MPAVMQSAVMGRPSKLRIDCSFAGGMVALVDQQGAQLAVAVLFDNKDRLRGGR